MHPLPEYIEQFLERHARDSGPFQQPMGVMLISFPD
jgi:hypothetical protein